MAKHMTQDDRKVLEARYNAGQSVAGIARAMSFNFFFVPAALIKFLWLYLVA